MSISDSGENLMNIRVLEDEEEGPRYTTEEMDLLCDQLKGARIPVAIRQDLQVDTPHQVDYDPLLGLLFEK